MANRIEKKVAEALLQEGIKIEIGGVEYVAPAPTLGTLVMVSEHISTLKQLGDDNDVSTVLRNARNGRKIAIIIAIYILGAKRIKQGPKKRLFKRFGIFPIHQPNSNEVLELADKILDECTPSQLVRILTSLMNASDLSDFFELSTFLRRVNLTAPTKVETKTTLSGQ